MRGEGTVLLQIVGVVPKHEDFWTRSENSRIHLTVNRLFDFVVESI